MTHYAIVFAAAAAAGCVLTLLVRTCARRFGVVDRPDGFRKVHGREVPMLGGVAIYGAIVLSVVACCLLGDGGEVATFLRSVDFWAILGGAGVILLVGVCDDVWGVRARWKFAVFCTVSLAMYVLGFRISSVSNPFGAPIVFGWLALPVTMFWFLGCINAINLVDGMDGLASGVVLFASATLFATSMFFGNAPAALLSATLAGALLGFLVFNFHPASIFLGDSGSLLLGFLVACIGLRGAQKSEAVVALLIPVIALGLPIMDTALAILRRSLKALPFFASDRQHIHHKLLEMGLSHRLAVLLMYGACLVLAELALLMTAANSLQAAGLLVILGLGTFLVLRTIGRHEFQLLRRRLGSYVERRDRRLQCRAAGYVASASMRQADSVESLWQTFARAAEKMQLDEAALTVLRSNGHGPLAFRYRPNGGNGKGSGNGNGDAADAEWTAVFPLRTNGTLLGQLHVRKSTNGDPLAGELPETLQLLTKALSINLDRVHGSTETAR